MLYLEDKKSCKDLVRGMSNHALIASLDDVVSIDLMKKSNIEWFSMNCDLALYYFLLAEINRRLISKSKKNSKNTECSCSMNDAGSDQAEKPGAPS